MPIEAALKAVRSSLIIDGPATAGELHSRIGWWTQETVTECLRFLVAIKAVKVGHDGRFTVPGALDRISGEVQSDVPSGTR